MNIKVVSKRSGLSSELGWSDVYVGRPFLLGNPFTMYSEADRETVVGAYRVWLWAEIKDEKSKARAELFAIARRVKADEKIRLVCWCFPLSCHADVICKAIIWLIESEQV